MLSQWQLQKALQKTSYSLRSCDGRNARLLCARSLAGRADTEAPLLEGARDPFSSPLYSSIGRLYPTHEQLNPLQKGAVAVLSAFGAALNPKRADLVAALGETTGSAAFWALRQRMLRSPTGRRILEERPRITDSVLASAASMPVGSFGHAYGQFMGRRHFRADERPPVRFVDDVQLAYVAQRAREVHDLWHVLFSCPTTVVGELALKALEFVQTGLPMAALSVAGAQWRLRPEERTRLNTQLLPWALRTGSSCADLVCLYYEEHFHESLADLQQRWQITPAPSAVIPIPVTGRIHASTL